MRTMKLFKVLSLKFKVKMQNFLQNKNPQETLNFKPETLNLMFNVLFIRVAIAQQP